MRVAGHPCGREGVDEHANFPRLPWMNLLSLLPIPFTHPPISFRYIRETPSPSLFCRWLENALSRLRVYTLLLTALMAAVCVVDAWGGGDARTVPPWQSLRLIPRPIASMLLGGGCEWRCRRSLALWAATVFSAAAAAALRRWPRPGVFPAAPGADFRSARDLSNFVVFYAAALGALLSVAGIGDGSPGGASLLLLLLGECGLEAPLGPSSPPLPLSPLQTPLACVPDGLRHPALLFSRPSLALTCMWPHSPSLTERRGEAERAAAACPPPSLRLVRR